MKIVKIDTTDLQVLLDLAEGYTSENGFAAVGRYAEPDAVRKAIIKGKAEIRRAVT